MTTTARRVPVEKPTEEAQRPTATTSPPWSAGPLAENLYSLRGEIDRLFGHAFHGWPTLFSPARSLLEWDPFRETHAPFGAMRGELAPRTDVSETDDAYRITIELPGVNEKDLEVTLTEGTLSVKGEKKSVREEKEKGGHLSERSYGRFRRMFRIPDDADADKVGADFANGVLTVTVPRTSEAKEKVRKIEIKAK